MRSIWHKQSKHLFVEIIHWQSMDPLSLKLYCSKQTSSKNIKYANRAPVAVTQSLIDVYNLIYPNVRREVGRDR